ncbi:MAG: TlpA family protein disulfide reductase [Acidobacteriota bacterium]|nr:TlpA family protein disulfide reductase [Acidobacteriota bacterium]
MSFIQPIRFCAGPLFLAATLQGATISPAATLWSELRQKREAFSHLHQEFEVSQTYKTADKTQTSTHRLAIDISHAQWRERSVSGSGNHLRIFDGADSFYLEENGDEVVRTKHRAKDELPAPTPYTISEPDWAKAKEVERRPCGLTGQDDSCVLLEVPLKGRILSVSGSSSTRRMGGLERMLIDLKTGVLLSATRVEAIESPTRRYQATLTYAIKNLTYGGPLDADFAKPQAEAREVKELSRWNAAKLRKQLSGKQAPELTVHDIRGETVSLADFKGKTVLLDFWTTWCPPCRADAPILDKLYAKYGSRDLMIVGVSVSEEHAVVEKFLAGHAQAFPTVLTTENEMPRPYQIGVFPTYIVIEKDGTVASAVEGDQGFAELRRMLKKAGMEVD